MLCFSYHGKAAAKVQPVHFMNERQAAYNIGPRPSTWAKIPSVGCCRPHLPSPFIIIVIIVIIIIIIIIIIC